MKILVISDLHYEGEDSTAIPKNILNILREHVLKAIKEINEKGIEKEEKLKI